MEHEVRQRLAAILAADVAGYTRLMADDERATIDALNTCRGIFRQAVEGNSGRVVDMAGDSVLAIFDTAIGAFNAALVAQERIAALNAEQPENRRMEYRVGLNTGDIHEQDDGTVYGDGVNIAARLESLAEPGGIVVSEDAQRNVRNRLEFGFEDIGSHRVKNVDEPVRAFRLKTGDLAAVPPKTRARSRRMLIGIGILTAVFAALVSWQSITSLEFGRDFEAETEAEADTDRAVAAPDGPVIAVLPFDNLSGDTEQEYFADGITDTLITDLSKLWNLGVIARHSSFTYKDRSVDVREIGEALGATHVLEGSILRAGGTVRVNVQLIDAASGEHVWADRFDGPINDIFAVQDSIVGEVISELNINLLDGEQARVWRQSTVDPEAYDLFLRARETQYGRSEADIAHSQQLFQAALDKDPTFSVAIFLLGLTHYDQAVAGWSDSPEESLATAERLYLEAIELDDSLGSAYAALGTVYLARQDHDRALEYAAQAIEITPGAANSLAIASIIYSYSGAPERGLELIERAVQLDPLPDSWFAHVKGAAHIFLGDHEAALAEYRSCLGQLPDFMWCNVNIIIPAMELGLIDEARARATEVLRISPTFDSETAVQVVRIKDPATRERWRELLRQAGLP